MINHKPPYELYDQTSKNFTEEVWYRTRSAIRALDILSTYQKRKPKDSQEDDEFKSIRYISTRFAVLEVACVLDIKSDLSLKLSKNHTQKYRVLKGNLKRLLKTLPEKDFIVVYDRVSFLVKNNNDLINKIFYTRNKKIAHASVPSFENSVTYLTSSRFPKTKFRKFSDELGRIFVETAFGYASGL